MSKFPRLKPIEEPRRPYSGRYLPDGTFVSYDFIQPVGKIEEENERAQIDRSKLPLYERAGNPYLKFSDRSRV